MPNPVSQSLDSNPAASEATGSTLATSMHPASKYRNVVAQSDFGPIIINVNDDTIGANITRNGYWGKLDILLIESLLIGMYGTGQPMVLLDVGTNIGTHTLAFAKYPFAQLTVHGFEAQREMFHMLAGTIALNGLSNVQLHHAAVSNVSGVDMVIPRVDYGSRSNFGSYELEPARRSDTADMYVEGAYDTIKTVCIDDLHLSSVRLIKIDVEGMEDKVVDGARHTIASQRPLLFIETFKTDFVVIHRFLSALKYRMYITKDLDAICIPGEYGIGVNGTTLLNP